MRNAEANNSIWPKQQQPKPLLAVRLPARQVFIEPTAAYQKALHPQSGRITHASSSSYCDGLFVKQISQLAKAKFLAKTASSITATIYSWQQIVTIAVCLLLLQRQQFVQKFN